MESMNRRRALKTLFCSSVALSLNLRHQAHADLAADATHLLAIGDFGTGGQDQRTVAAAMRSFVEKENISPAGMWFIGDNMYGPTKGGFSADCFRWKEEIEDMYPATVFPGPQWAVLGNHDYHDNDKGEEAQLAYSKKPGVRWHMPNKWYRVDLGGAKPLVTFLALDTNFPKISGGIKKKTGKVMTHMGEEAEAAQLEWLKAELAKPRAPFTVVVGHHPLYSNGSHRDTKLLIEQWGDLFQQHKVHAYLCGHDHDMQHLELEGKFTSFILSGGGGARIRKLVNAVRKIPYGKDIHGFTHIQIQPDSLTFTHRGVDGSVLHRFAKKQDGTVII